MSAIRVENLVKKYGKIEALRGVSLEVREGEIFGLLGRNGAGKTTLVKVLLNVVFRTSGDAKLLDQPVENPNARRHVGYLPEDHRFPEYRTGAGALEFYAGLSGLNAATRRTRIPELLALVGLTADAHRLVRGYSKGMKQRLGLAQALLTEPKLLLLDEPTDGVDPVGRAEIRTLLVKLKSQGKTIFLNSHMLGEVERLCDRVAIVEKGQLLKQGTIEELTRTAAAMVIHTVPAPNEAVRAELGKLCRSVKDAGGALEVTLEKEEQLDAVVDLLRARGLSIRELAPKRLTLEDVFLDTLGPGTASPGALSQETAR